MSDDVWIARDADGDLWLHTAQPEQLSAYYGGKLWGSGGAQVALPREEQPDIKPGECVRFALVRADEAEGGNDERD